MFFFKYHFYSKFLQLPSLNDMKTLTTQFIKKKNKSSLHKIRIGLAGGEQYVSEFMNVSGGLYALIGCLTGNCLYIF